MPSARTTLTEVSTALGCLDLPNLDWSLLIRPPIVGVTASDWQEIDAEIADPKSRRLAEVAFENGRCFREHPDGLRNRTPAVVEWTGGRRPPGDQAIPADLRIDHVYLVSCKYLSKILLNTAPSRVFDALLRPGSGQAGDWYDLVAPVEHRELAAVAARTFGLGSIQSDRVLDQPTRAALKRAFGRHVRLTGELAAAYQLLCEAVSLRSAEHWRKSLKDSHRGAAEALLWRMLRLASGTYFVLGVGSAADALRLRVMTPWDWRQHFSLRRFEVEAAGAGQPQVRWCAVVLDRLRGEERTIDGHVEVRWSHGRFAGPPEAKVYLDTPHADVPGFVVLE